MTYTIEDVKRLVPEAVAVRQYEHQEHGWTVAFGLEEEGLFSDFGPGLLLLSTRRKLEIARQGLETISDVMFMLELPNNAETMRGFARQALDAINKEGEL